MAVTHLKSIQPRQHQGFSLVEILIASALGLFLLSAIVQVFSQSQATVMINQSINETQDRGRTLLHHLGFNLKQRGFQGCLPPIALDVNKVDDIDWIHDSPVIALAKKIQPVPYSQTALQAFEVSSAGVFSPAPSSQDLIDLATGSIGVFPKPQSDVIRIQYGDRRSTPLINTMNTENSAIEIGNNALGLETGDIIMVGDCTAADIVTITKVNNIAGIVQLEHGLSDNRQVSLTKPYSTDARVRRFRQYTYFVGDSGRQTKRQDVIFSLYRLDYNDTLVELSEGVDYLQLAYKSSSSLGVQNITADSAVFNSMKVIGVDVGLLVVGLKDVLSSDDTKVYRLPGAAVGPATGIEYVPNKLLKTPFQSYVDLKNRG